MLVSSALQTVNYQKNQSANTALREETVQQRVSAGELRISRRKQIVLNFHINAGVCT